MFQEDKEKAKDRVIFTAAPSSCLPITFNYSIIRGSYRSNLQTINEVDENRVSRETGEVRYVKK